MRIIFVPDKYMFISLRIFLTCYASQPAIILLYLSGSYSLHYYLSILPVYLQFMIAGEAAILITCALPVACNTLASAHDSKLGLNNKTRLHTPFGD